MKHTVIVTGATAGFGAAISRRFLAQGHKVIATGRRQDRLDQLKNDLPSDQQALLFTAILDVCDPNAVANFPKTLPSEFANVTILVNNVV